VRLGECMVRGHKAGDLECVGVFAYPHPYLYCMHCCHSHSIVGEAWLAPPRSEFFVVTTLRLQEAHSCPCRLFIEPPNVFR
jgi:hypothetical protein